METETDQTPRQKIEAACAELGLTMTAEFVPFSKSRNAKPREDGKVWRSLNWNVTILRNLRVQTRDPIDAPRAILTTDYGAGEAHCPAYKNPPKFASGKVDPYGKTKCIEWECENGTPARWSNVGDHITKADPRTKLLPELADVVSSLVHDASVIDETDFEGWAANVGYDPDSRKAEATYRACLEIALKLRNGVGEAGLAKLRDACQDY